jgi:hypothetical protein
MKKLLMGIALLGAFSFSFAQTTAAGNAFANWLGNRNNDTMLQILGQAHSVNSTLVTPNELFEFQGYSGNISMNVGAFDTSFVSQFAASSSHSSMVAYRDYVSYLNSLFTVVPWGPSGTSYPFVQIQGSCKAKGGTFGNKLSNISISGNTTAGEEVFFYHRVNSNQFVFRWHAQTSDFYRDYSGSTLSAQQSQYSVVAFGVDTISVCQKPVNLYYWTVGAYPGGSANMATVAGMREWARPWVRSWDVSGVYSPRAGISHTPVLSAGQAAEPCPGTECVYVPPGGGTGGEEGGETIDTEAEAGACSQVTGNWFTKFWANLEVTLECQLVPSENFSDRVTANYNALKERVPFGFVNWLVQGQECYLGSDEMIPSTSSTYCSNGQIVIDFPFMGEVRPFVIALYGEDNVAVAWWHEWIRPMLYWGFMAAFVAWAFRMFLS